MRTPLIVGTMVVIIAIMSGFYIYSQQTISTNDTSIVNPVDTACIKAGEVSPQANSCCSGLFRIFVAEYTPTQSCIELSEHSMADGTVYYICSDCGNKNCESWENRCNCPQDCKYP